MNIKVLAVFLFAILQGCATATAEFTKTGSYSSEGRDLNCSFNVFLTAPDKHFKEIGVVDFVGHYSWMPHTASEAKNLASSDVCSNGGNGLLLWEANGDGGYTKGVVIHFPE